MSDKTLGEQAAELAQRFHETYERLAPSFGYETRKESAKPWSEVPDQNKRLMTAVCSEIIDTLHAQQPCGCEKLREAAQTFVDRLKVIHDNPLYQTIWLSAANHGIDYSNGPKYEKELAALVEVLAQPCQQPQASVESEEWTFEDKFGCWQIWSAKGCEGDHLLEVAAKSLCQSHNASLRHQSAPAADGKIDRTLPDSLDLRNGGQRCDLITGPCACGAWHRLEEMPWRLQNQLRQSAPVEAWRDLDVTRPVESDGDEYGRILCRWSDEEIRTWPVSHFTKNEPTGVTHWAPLPKFEPERKT